MKIIDTEAHFFTGTYLDYLRNRKEIPREEAYKDFFKLWYHPSVWEPHGPLIDDKLLDLAEGRLREMDDAGVDMQVLSLATPGCEQFKPADGVAWARRTNDSLAEVINKYPDRFIGLAALATQNPDEAAKELERAVRRLGLKGAKLNSNAGGAYLDDKKFWSIFETAENLKVPIYLHPSSPTPSLAESMADYGFALCGPALGFGIETAIHTMRLIYGGVFDRFPGLNMILGHMGEGLVHWIYRIDFAFKKPWIDSETRPEIKKSPSHCLKENFFITTSGMNSVPAFLNAYLEMGGDRIMFSADYPFESSAESVEFIKHIPIAGNDRGKICSLNAEKLFKI
jgi:5-carboxyvanillate decarboxylase